MNLTRVLEEGFGASFTSLSESKTTRYSIERSRN
jgi:hypothetical protein